MNQLRQLSDLRASGALSEKEYMAAKAKLLGHQISSSSTPMTSSTTAGSGFGDLSNAATTSGNGSPLASLL